MRGYFSGYAEASSVFTSSVAGASTGAVHEQGSALQVVHLLFSSIVFIYCLKLAITIYYYKITPFIGVILILTLQEHQ